MPGAWAFALLFLSVSLPVTSVQILHWSLWTFLWRLLQNRPAWASLWCRLCCGSPFPEMGLAFIFPAGRWAPSFQTLIILFCLTARFLVPVSSFLVLSHSSFFLLSSPFCSVLGTVSVPPPLPFRCLLFCRWGSARLEPGPLAPLSLLLLLLVLQCVCRPSATYCINPSLSLLLFSQILTFSSFSPLLFHIKASCLRQDLADSSACVVLSAVPYLTDSSRPENRVQSSWVSWMAACLLV